MSNTLDINGTQYDYNYFKSSTGYKCCTIVEHNINLYNNSNAHQSTIDIPVVDCNCHILMMHLYNNDTLVDLGNVSRINIKFICGNKIVIGDYRKLRIVNSCRGTISYILDSDITSNVGVNSVVVELQIGSGTITFTGTYNVVPNVQTDTTTVVLPDTERDSENVYGPHCREVLTILNNSENNNSGGCGCDCDCCSKQISEDELNANNITLRDLYFSFIAHSKNPNIHLNAKDRDTLNSAFKTVETYSDLLKEIGCTCGVNTIANGRLYKVNNVNGFTKYYEWDAAAIGFKEVTFGSEGAPGRDATDILWNETGLETEVQTTVGGLQTGTDISNLTITQIIAKMLGLNKQVPKPIIELEDKEISLDNNVSELSLYFDVTNLVPNLTYNVDLSKLVITGDKEFNFTKIFDSVGNTLIINFTNLTPGTEINIKCNEGMFTQTGDPTYGYSNITVESDEVSCVVTVLASV